MELAELVKLMNRVNANLDTFVQLQSESRNGGFLGITRKIDFGGIVVKTAHCTIELDDITELIGTPSDEHEELFLAYIAAQKNSEMLFGTAMLRLSKKAAGTSYPASDYKNDMTKLRNAEEKRISMGSKMNTIYQAASKYQ